MAIDFQMNWVSFFLGKIGTKAFFGILDHTFPVQDISTFIKAVKITKYTAESLYQQVVENENVEEEKEIVD